MRLAVVVLLSVLACACSTPIPLDLSGGEYVVPPPAPVGPLDAGRPQPTDAGRDGGRDAGATDASTRDAGAAGPLTCQVFGTSPTCSATPPTEGGECAFAGGGGPCAYPSEQPGFARVAECATSPGSSRFAWRSYQARCSYQCDEITQNPAFNFLSLLVNDCAMRPVTSCENGLVRTSQEALDQVLAEALDSCLSAGGELSAALRINVQGCPDLFFIDASLDADERRCVSTQLEGMRFGCRGACALVQNVLLR